MFTSRRSNRIWASSSAPMKIAQCRDSSALLMQTPHSLIRRARSFPHRRDRDASSWSTNHDAAFLRDVIPRRSGCRNEAWSWTIKTTCSVNFARYYLLLLLEDANTHRMRAIRESTSSIRSIIQRFLFST